jgi:hypothetical protein
MDLINSNGNNILIQPERSDVTYVLFNKSNYIFILWFLAIYVVAYFLVGLIFKRSLDSISFSLRLSRGIDFLVLLTLLILLFVSYFNNSEPSREVIYNNVIGGYSSFINNPISIFTVIFYLILFYIVLFLFRVPMDKSVKSATVSLLETAGWITLILICFVDFFKYVLQTSLTNLISDITNYNNLPYDLNAGINVLKPSGNIITANISNLNKINGNTISGNLNLSQPVQKDEVFNISNNLYTYDDAQAICSAYGATIATYDQIEDAYNHGAEWCNYGWSDGQMAYFPTQKSTWNKLQATTDHKNDCGRPGVNGGYFANPYIKFGVNCFGKKPAPSQSDLDRMAANSDIIPKSPGDHKLNGKINFWKQNAGNLLVLNSFDRTQWSEY